MKKTLYIVGGSLFGVVLLYFGYDLYKTNKSKNEAIANSTQIKGDKDGVIGDGQQSSDGAKESRDSFPLKVGKYGYRVAVLQSALNKLGSSLTVDGAFGQMTYDAIITNTDQWNFTCRVGALCGLDKDEYDSILINASKENWIQKNAEELAKDSWLPFVDLGINGIKL